LEDTDLNLVMKKPSVDMLAKVMSVKANCPRRMALDIFEKEILQSPP
jgi:hypothetical protein